VEVRWRFKENYSPTFILYIYISVLSMIACPFLVGFYFKDLIIESLYISEIRMFLILIMLISLTITYSVRLLYYLFFTKSISFMLIG